MREGNSRLIAGLSPPSRPCTRSLLTSTVRLCQHRRPDVMWWVAITSTLWCVGCRMYVCACHARPFIVASARKIPHLSLFVNPSCSTLPTTSKTEKYRLHQSGIREAKQLGETTPRVVCPTRCRAAAEGERRTATSMWTTAAAAATTTTSSTTITTQNVLRSRR